MVEEMNERNNTRKSSEMNIIREIEAQLEENPVSPEDNFLLFSGKNWHKGIIGIVASRMTNRFYRPCLVLSAEGDSCQGSGRSIPGFHLLEALASCDDLFSRYGGHAQAAGCSLDTADPGQIETLKRRLNEYAGKVLSEDQKIPSLDIDAYIPVKEVGQGIYDQVKLMEPFGKANPEPVFASRNVEISNEPKLLNRRGIKMRAMAGSKVVDMIWWQKDSIPENLGVGSHVDVAYSLQEQTFEGNKSIYMNIRDMRVF